MNFETIWIIAFASIVVSFMALVAWLSYLAYKDGND